MVISILTGVYQWLWPLPWWCLPTGCYGGSGAGDEVWLCSCSADRLQRLHNHPGGGAPFCSADQHLHSAQRGGGQQHPQSKLCQRVTPRAHAPLHRAGVGLFHGSGNPPVSGWGGSALLDQIPPSGFQRSTTSNRGPQDRSKQWLAGGPRVHHHHGPGGCDLLGVHCSLLPLSSSPQDGTPPPGDRRTPQDQSSAGWPRESPPDCVMPSPQAPPMFTDPPSIDPLFSATCPAHLSSPSFSFLSQAPPTCCQCPHLFWSFVYRKWFTEKGCCVLFIFFCLFMLCLMSGCNIMSRFRY